MKASGYILHSGCRKSDIRRVQRELGGSGDVTLADILLHTLTIQRRLQKLYLQ